MYPPSAILSSERLEALCPAAVAFQRMLFEPRNPAADAEQEHDVEQTQQLIMQHPHRYLLGNVTRMGQLPGNSTKGMFYGTETIV
jgi:hypothetical protein